MLSSVDGRCTAIGVDAFRRLMDCWRKCRLSARRRSRPIGGRDIGALRVLPVERRGFEGRGDVRLEPPMSMFAARSMPDRLSLQRVTIILVAATILSLSMGLRQCLGLFLPPIRVDLGVSASQFGLAMALQNIVWGFGQPFIGMLGDRFGARPVLIGRPVRRIQCRRRLARRLFLRRNRAQRRNERRP